MADVALVDWAREGGGCVVDEGVGDAILRLFAPFGMASPVFSADMSRKPLSSILLLSRRLWPLLLLVPVAAGAPDWCSDLTMTSSSSGSSIKRFESLSPTVRIPPAPPALLLPRDEADALAEATGVAESLSRWNASSRGLTSLLVLIDVLCRLLTEPEVDAIAVAAAGTVALYFLAGGMTAAVM